MYNLLLQLSFSFIFRSFMMLSQSLLSLLIQAKFINIFATEHFLQQQQEILQRFNFVSKKKMKKIFFQNDAAWQLQRGSVAAWQRGSVTAGQRGSGAAYQRTSVPAYQRGSVSNPKNGICSNVNWNTLKCWYNLILYWLW